MQSSSFGEALTRLWPKGDEKIPGLRAGMIASAPAVLLCLASLVPPPQDRDPRCNSPARYEAMAEGANCSGSEAWLANKGRHDHRSHKRDRNLK